MLILGVGDDCLNDKKMIIGRTGDTTKTTASKEYKEAQHICSELPVMVYAKSLLLGTVCKDNPEEIQRYGLISRCNWVKCFKPIQMDALHKTAICCKKCNMLWCSKRCEKLNQKSHTYECDDTLNKTPYYLAIRTLSAGIRFPYQYFPSVKVSNDTLKEIMIITKDKLITKFPQYTQHHIISTLLCVFQLQKKLKIMMGDYEYGSCLYLRTSYIKHSCDPNAYWYTSHDGTIVIKAAINIKENEDITIAYDNDCLFTSKTFRQDFLQSNFGIDCNCTRCSSEEREILDDVYFNGIKDDYKTSSSFAGLIMELCSSKNLGDLDWKILFDGIQVCRKYTVKTNTILYQLLQRLIVILFNRSAFHQGILSCDQLSHYFKLIKTAHILRSVNHIAASTLIIKSVYKIYHDSTTSNHHIDPQTMRTLSDVVLYYFDTGYLCLDALGNPLLQKMFESLNLNN